MSDDLDEIARSVDRAARAVDGVEDVYSARPLVARAARRLVDDTDEPLALVRRHRDVLEVTVSVAVAADRVSAAGVAAAVGEAVHAVVDSANGSAGAAPRVRVRVSRVLAARDEGSAIRSTEA